MKIRELLNTKSAQVTEFMSALLLLAAFCGVLSVGVQYGLPMMVHAKSENKLQTVGTLSLVKAKCHSTHVP